MELDLNYFKMNKAIFSLLSSDGLIAIGAKSLAIYLSAIFFDPKDFEVATNLT